MLLALEDYLHPPQIVLLRGPQPAIEPWPAQLNAVFAPRRWTLAVPADARELPAAIADKPGGRGRDGLRLPRRCSARAPIDSLAALLKLVGPAQRPIAESPQRPRPPPWPPPPRAPEGIEGIERPAGAAR